MAPRSRPPARNCQTGRAARRARSAPRPAAPTRHQAVSTSRRPPPPRRAPRRRPGRARGWMPRRCASPRSWGDLHGSAGEELAEAIALQRLALLEFGGGCHQHGFSGGDEVAHPVVDLVDDGARLVVDGERRLVAVLALLPEPG